jgi:hypothetical protein
VPKRKRKLSPTEVRRQHGAALPGREAMSMIVPSTELPLVPADGGDPIAAGPALDGGASRGPASGAAPEGTSTYAPENQARAVNHLSPGAVQGSTSTQNAPINQSS